MSIEEPTHVSMPGEGPQVIVVGSGPSKRSDAEIVAHPTEMPKWVDPEKLKRRRGKTLPRRVPFWQEVLYPPLPEFKDLLAKHDQQQAALHEAEQTFSQTQYDLLEATHSYLKLPKQQHLILGEDSWPCPTSPIGVCVYDPVADPSLDSCLLCGGPEERK